MDKIIGLGKLGCLIAEELTQHPEYRIYKVDVGIKERGSLSLDPQSDMEQYERQFDATAAEVYFRSIKPGDEVLLVMQGGEPVTGCALQLLQTIKDAKLNVLYICPDRHMISGIQKRDDKIAFNIMQEYARSGVLQNIFLVNKYTVESLMGDVSIQNYEKEISHFISYVIAMINYFYHTEPVVSNKFEPVDWCRIVTFGISSLDAEEDIRLLFPLDAIADIHFFYGIPSENLKDDPTLMKKIKQHVKNYTQQNISTSFSVYSTTFEDIMVLCSATSSRIQDFPSYE